MLFFLVRAFAKQRMMLLNLGTHEKTTPIVLLTS